MLAKHLIGCGYNGFRQGKFQGKGIGSAHPADFWVQEVYPILVKIVDVVGGVALAPVVGGVDFGGEVEAAEG